MTETTMITLAPAVRFEPCWSYDDDPGDAGVCAGCGWTVDDHDEAAVPLAA